MDKTKPIVHNTRKSVAKSKGPFKLVQVYGQKKTAVAVATCRKGYGNIRVNGRPLDLIQPSVLRSKAKEALLVLGEKYFNALDIKIHVKGGGQVAQIYAVRQAIAKSLIAYYHKFDSEATKRLLKDTLIKFDRSILVADPRRCEPKKFGGPGARSRFQKSYR